MSKSQPVIQQGRGTPRPPLGKDPSPAIQKAALGGQDQPKK
jgi:hypothetical protein